MPCVLFGLFAVCGFFGGFFEHRNIFFRFVFFAADRAFCRKDKDADKGIKNGENGKEDQKIGGGCKSVCNELNTENDQKDHTEQMQNRADGKRQALRLIDAVDKCKTESEQQYREGPQKRRTEEDCRLCDIVGVIKHIKVNAV